MNDTLLGIIIGGAIGVVPTLVTLIINVWQERSRQKHAMCMSRIELFEKTRLEAIQTYAKMAGALMSDSYGTEFGQDKYFSAYQNTCLFVSQKTRKAMLSFNDVLLVGWRDAGYTNLTDSRDYKKPYTEQYAQLCDALLLEIQSSWYPERKSALSRFLAEDPAPAKTLDNNIHQ